MAIEITKLETPMFEGDILAVPTSKEEAVAWLTALNNSEKWCYHIDDDPRDVFANISEAQARHLKDCLWFCETLLSGWDNVWTAYTPTALDEIEEASGSGNPDSKEYKAKKAELDAAGRAGLLSRLGSR